MNWLKLHWGDLCIGGGLLLFLVWLAWRLFFRQQRNSSGSCGFCDGCGSCSMRDSCAARNLSTKDKKPI